MQRIMEPIFEIPYLIGVVVLGVVIIIKSKKRLEYIIFGAMAIILGLGDAFHLVPRMYALIVSGQTDLVEYAFALGLGKMITSITMTFFYVLLYHVWMLRYQKNNRIVTISIYVLAVARIILCLLPQNEWFILDSPLSYGIYRNIPFVILGGLIIYLYYKEARKNNDKSFRLMWLAITLSFLFYIPVVLLASKYPLVGMLMIPKTIAYVWIVLMGFNSLRKANAILLADNQGVNT